MDNSGNGSGHDGAGADRRAARRRRMEGLRPECARMLEAAGFTYDKQAGAWFSLQAGSVIPFDAVADRTPEWLAGWLSLSASPAATSQD
jgi:hypothetical protein